MWVGKGSNFDLGGKIGDIFGYILIIGFLIYMIYGLFYQ
jgi:hypothetical protein